VDELPNRAATQVFISYSHDSPLLKARVLEVANRLRTEGIASELDAYHEAPPEGWPRWMLNQMEEARFVLFVCTETYHRRFRGRESAGSGRGAKWEGAVITQELYQGELLNTKFNEVHPHFGGPEGRIAYPDHLEGDDLLRCQH
jgi:hypothetical protein